jgi:hypothetical protein
VRYLLDGNALIAMGVKNHQHYRRIALWSQSHTTAEFLSCSITEIGFVRVVAQVAAYGMNVRQARTLLLEMKSNPIPNLQFLADGNDIAFQPHWADSPSRITDGHLLQLAIPNDAVLATLDRGIPGAHLIL